MGQLPKLNRENEDLTVPLIHCVTEMIITPLSVASFNTSMRSVLLFGKFPEIINYPFHIAVKWVILLFNYLLHNIVE